MLITPAYAQAAGAAGQTASGFGSFGLLLPYLALIPLFYFLVIRPGQQRQKAHRALIDAVKKGDQVVTAGGLVGKVTKVEDAFVEVEIAANTRVRVVKATLAEVTGATAARPAND